MDAAYGAAKPSRRSAIRWYHRWGGLIILGLIFAALVCALIYNQTPVRSCTTVYGDARRLMTGIPFIIFGIFAPGSAIFLAGCGSGLGALRTPRRYRYASIPTDLLFGVWLGTLAAIYSGHAVTEVLAFAFLGVPFAIYYVGFLISVQLSRLGGFIPERARCISITASEAAWCITLLYRVVIALISQFAGC